MFNHVDFRSTLSALLLLLLRLQRCVETWARQQQWQRQRQGQQRQQQQRQQHQQLQQAATAAAATAAAAASAAFCAAKLPPPLAARLRGPPPPPVKLPAGMPPPSTTRGGAPKPVAGPPVPGPSCGAPEPAATRPRHPGPSLRIASWNVDVPKPGVNMTRTAENLAKMLQHVDIVLLQELGPWDKPLSDAEWALFLTDIVGKKADEWDAHRNGPYAVLARRKDPRGGCGSDATKLFPWLEAPS